jgi:hypothetical protein
MTIVLHWRHQLFECGPKKSNAQKSLEQNGCLDLPLKIAPKKGGVSIVTSLCFGAERARKKILADRGGSGIPGFEVA